LRWNLRSICFYSSKIVTKPKALNINKDDCWWEMTTLKKKTVQGRTRDITAGIAFVGLSTFPFFPLPTGGKSI
jgi:hypothetical protein